MDQNPYESPRIPDELTGVPEQQWDDWSITVLFCVVLAAMLVSGGAWAIFDN
jgi:hypothetical protein